MAAVLQFPVDERVEINNRIRDLAFELGMQATLLAHIDPQESFILTGKARGLLLACEILMENDNA